MGKFKVPDIQLSTEGYSEVYILTMQDKKWIIEVPYYVVEIYFDEYVDKAFSIWAEQSQKKKTVARGNYVTLQLRWHFENYFTGWDAFDKKAEKFLSLPHSLYRDMFSNVALYFLRHLGFRRGVDIYALSLRFRTRIVYKFTRGGFKAIELNLESADSRQKIDLEKIDSIPLSPVSRDLLKLTNYQIEPSTAIEIAKWVRSIIKKIFTLFSQEILKDTYFKSVK